MAAQGGRPVDRAHRLTLAKHGLLVLLAAAVFVTGLLGIDFGQHWDELRMARSVRQVIDAGRLLPPWYNYPSIVHHLVWWTLVPDAVVAAVGGGTDGFKKRLTHRVFEHTDTLRFTHTHTLRARTLFLSLTMLSVVWTYLFVLAWGRRWPEAILAAAVLASSWEAAYHARWIAPDGILMQFTALCMLTSLLALKRRSRRWLVVSAVAAGLACGTKYPGGILLLPVLIVAATGLNGRRKTVRANLAPAGLVLAVFGAAFLGSTPGAVLDRARFVEDVISEVRHYWTGHEGYTVRPGLEHAGLMGRYLTLSAFSKLWPLALSFFSFSVAGAAFVWKRDRPVAWLLLSAPLVYFVYMSTQRVMFVRNLLILFPFIAVLSAHGIAGTVSAIRSGAARRALGAAVGAALLVNLGWLGYASGTIRSRASMPYGERVLSYIDRRPGETFFLSATVKHRLESYTARGFVTNVAGSREAATRCLIDTCDAFERRKWPANRFIFRDVVSGPYEINFDCYPSWGGDCRVIAVDPEAFDRLGVVR